MPPVFTAIGNACTDLVAKVDESFLKKNEIPKSFCKFITDPQEFANIKAQIGHYESIGGGAGANVAHVISALGGHSHFIGKIANDDFGISFKQNLENNGVSCHFPPPSSAECGSPQVSTLITPDGERSFVSFDGVARHFSFDDYDKNILDQTNYLYLDGYCFCSAFTGKSFIKVAENLRNQGGHVTFNIGDKGFYNSHKPNIDSLLSICDSVICNEAEAIILFGQFPSINLLAEHLSKRFLFGAITLGVGGAIVFYDKKIIKIPVIHPSKIIDTNGAGDHFSGGFVYGLMNGYTLEQAGKLGALCSADCLSHSGARPLGGFESLKNLRDLI